MQVTHHGLDCWMYNTPELYKLRIDELILPGTHDSGADKKAPNLTLPQEKTQDVPIIEQILAGFRVLDLRVVCSGNAPPGSDGRFQLFHLTSSGRTVGGDVLDQLNNFYDDLDHKATRAKEIIILNFHKFKNFTRATHRELHELIHTKIGQRLIPRNWRKATVEDIWTHRPGRTVVISYNHRVRAKYWKGVEHQWSGKNLNTTSALKTFMDEQSARKKPDFVLRSIQCAKYVLPLHIPDDFSDKIDLWFESRNSDSYIQRFHIINTDWSTRSQIVFNCMHANRLRAKAKSAFLTAA
ncbi:hypothetical protein [Pseudomonas sp. NFACC36]|uniref:hypothetical protein n=1 Tax=Pseudomonas sp. NFACC36 TaxID=1566197 RepID=UPI000914CB5F|nr:hypothetical protein [Pseudomonas sp. NFACC36]SFX20152.1 hypothetical protein SAMN03159309_00809 [Pseudomonas sp. NFACC36]